MSPAARLRVAETLETLIALYTRRNAAGDAGKLKIANQQRLQWAANR